jgi:hypothetical protein
MDVRKDFVSADTGVSGVAALLNVPEKFDPISYLLFQGIEPGSRGLKINPLTHYSTPGRD